MTSEAKVLCEQRDHVFWMTLNRPDKRNAIDHDMTESLHDGPRQAHANPEIRAVVLTGTGDKAFCADLGGDGFVFDYSQPTSAYLELLRYAVRSTLPIVARVNGACMAGGMGLFYLADMAVAADHAVFGLPEVKVGGFPMQVLSLLRNFVAPRVLNEWCLTGEPFSAETAREAGLLNYVVPADELDSRVDWLVARRSISH